MNTPQIELLDGETLNLDNSTYQLMTVCPRMAAYKILWKRDKAGTAIARDSGKSIHTALEYRYRTFGSGPVSPEGEAKMIDLFEEEFSKLQDVPEDTHLNMTRLKEVLRDYNKHWQREPFEVTAVEIPMAAVLGEIKTTGKRLPSVVKIIWTGRSDLITKWEDGYFTTDHKTTGKWDSAKINQFSIDEGQRGYAWLVQELARTNPELGFPSKVSGFCVNGIVMLRDLKRAPTDKTLPRNSFHRERFFWTPEGLEEWRENTLAAIGVWLNCYEQDYFPMHKRNCANYFGLRCGYWDVCGSPASQRNMILGMDLYKDVTWCPLHRVE
jgi:hypothetical protein